MNFKCFNLQEIKEHELFNDNLLNQLRCLCTMQNTINFNEYNTIDDYQDSLKYFAWKIDYKIDEQNNEIIVNNWYYEDFMQFKLNLSLLTNNNDFEKFQNKYNEALQEIQKIKVIEQNEKEILKSLQEKYKYI